MSKQTHSFQAEVAQLLHLVTHSLYSNPEIFLRELISNASDACDKLRFEALNNAALYEGQSELQVRVAFDEAAKTLTIEDNGIGMSAQEAVENLGTIAKSGTKAFVDPALHDLDLIVPIITMSKIEQAEAENLTRAVESGVGLAGFHGGAGDSFRECVDYQFMIGGQWVAHPGNVIDHVINITRPDDPIMAGIEDFPYRSEQYYMHVDPSNEVLATTRFSGDHAWWIDGVVMPVVWKRYHGKGRVFYSSMGHQAKEFDVLPMQTIFRRGAVWAANKT